jgi:hypothetical protein
MATDAVQLTRLTPPFVPQSPRLKKRGEVTPVDQQGPLAVNRRQAVFDPPPHGVPVNTKEARHFLYGVAAVNLDESIVWVTFRHGARSEEIGSTRSAEEPKS